MHRASHHRRGLTAKLSGQPRLDGGATAETREPVRFAFGLSYARRNLLALLSSAKVSTFFLRRIPPMGFVVERAIGGDAVRTL